MKPYSEFTRAIRIRESSGLYHAKNSLGYLGAYQFGMARLWDLGLTELLNPDAPSLRNSAYRFKEPFTEEIFLSSPSLQDFLFDHHVLDYRKKILKLYPLFNPKISGPVPSGTLRQLHLPEPFDVPGMYLSGCIGVCHLLGFGGLLSLLRRGSVLSDAYGTTAIDYLRLFHGYAILDRPEAPLSLPEFQKRIGG